MARRTRAVAVVAVFVCAVSATTAPKEQALTTEPVAKTLYEGKVFGPDAVKNGLVVGTWTPTQEQVDAVQGNIQAALRAQGEPFLGIAERLSEYVCQYMCIDVGGERAIHCSFLMTASGVTGDWKTSWLTVNGGGDRFFRVDYLVASERFVGAQINSDR